MVQPDTVASDRGARKASTTTDSASKRTGGTKSSVPSATTISKKQKAAQGPKKCHHCKESKMDWAKCQYMLPTGSKCGKYYCGDCLKNDYSQPVPKFDPDDASWQ